MSLPTALVPPLPCPCPRPTLAGGGAPGLAARRLEDRSSYYSTYKPFSNDTSNIGKYQFTPGQVRAEGTNQGIITCDLMQMVFPLHVNACNVE